MSGRFVAIVNPLSGRRNMAPLVRQIGRLLKRQGARLDVFETTGSGHATELAARVEHDVDAVLVAGGDGTLWEVINGLVGKDVPIVVLAGGTENLLARELKMPDSPEGVARTLLQGKWFSYDVGVVNGRRFLVVVGVGFDAECVVRMNRVRRGHITYLDYFWPIWRVFWSYRFPVLHVEADGACVFDGRGVLLVSMIPRYSIGLRLFDKARYDDGLLDLCVFPCTSRTRLAAHAFRAFCRRHIGRGGVIYRQSHSIRVSSPDRVPIEVDGELGGHLPAELSLLPGAGKFLRLGPGCG